MYIRTSAGLGQKRNLDLADFEPLSADLWGVLAAPPVAVKPKVATKKSPSRRIRRGWKRISIQLNLTNYRAVPLEFYFAIAYIVDGKSGERVLLGSAKPLGSATSGTTGVITFTNEILPAEGTLVIRVIPEYRTVGDRTMTRGEFVGDVLSGTIAWKRNRRVKIYNVTQETADVTVKARTREEAQTKLQNEGKIGLVIGPLEFGAGGGSERTKSKGTELEIEYKAKVALPSLKIVAVQ